MAPFVFATFVFFLSVFILPFAACAAALNSHHREHLQSHAEGQLDLAAMSEEELKFMYFKSHDVEGNNKLDGLELIQSLLHFHEEESVTHGEHAKIFTDAEFAAMVDPIMQATDKNMDGFIDYPEFAASPGIISY